MIDLSLEDKLNNIENQYTDLYKRYEELYENYEYEFDIVNASIKSTLKLLTDMELLYEEVKKMVDDSIQEYFNRITKSIFYVRGFLRGVDKQIGAIQYFDLKEPDLEEAFNNIKIIRNYVFQFCEDTRLLYNLRIYPIEEKIVLKSKLSDYNFIDTINCLDEVDDNIAKNHYKDAIDRGREGLEKLVSGILIELNKKPSNYFSTDIGTLSGMGFIDKENKKLIEATYSFLSEVGAHGRAGKYEYSDTYYAVKETYMRIDILINLLEKYLKK